MQGWGGGDREGRGAWRGEMQWVHVGDGEGIGVWLVGLCWSFWGDLGVCV